MAAIQKDDKAIALIKTSDVPVPWDDEYEKMISGMSFAAKYSQTMPAFKLQMLRFLKDFNDDAIAEDATWESLRNRRMAVARGFLGKVGVSVNIEPPFFCTWGCTIFIGDHIYINLSFVDSHFLPFPIYDSAPVTIGSHVYIAPDVKLCTDLHETSASERAASGHTTFAKPITIEDNCWLCVGVTVLSGVTIGKGSTVAAGAVVIADVEPYFLVGGVPAKLIKRLDGYEPEVGVAVREQGEDSAC